MTVTGLCLCLVPEPQSSHSVNVVAAVGAAYAMLIAVHRIEWLPTNDRKK